jgi:hypothetical protein
MAKRPTYRRAGSEIRRGRIGKWPANGPSQVEVSGRVHYIPNGEHKNYPSPTNAWIFGPKKDKSLCLRYPQEAWPQLTAGLRTAIAGPCISEEFRSVFPARAWIYVDGLLHEVRLSSETNGEYHGFPVEYQEAYPEDPQGKLKDCPRVTINSN